MNNPPTKDAICAAIIAIESGIEYARECLASHDSSLGRTTPKNKRCAERMELDIVQMAHALEIIKLTP
jgi:hypothetical protein